MMKQWMYHMALLLFALNCGVTHAITPLDQKGVIVRTDAERSWQEPSWFQPHSLEDAPIEISFWIDKLPFEYDQYSHDSYIVIPQLGLIAPIQSAKEKDQQKIFAGHEIDINTYLRNGVLHYYPQQESNMIIVGHSNYAVTDPGRYKTIFSSIMSLDSGVDEVWLYTRGKEREYTRQVFIVEQSYETVPQDTLPLLPTLQKSMTLIACTNGTQGRWIVRAIYKPEKYFAITNPERIMLTHDLTQKQSTHHFVRSRGVWQQSQSRKQLSHKLFN